MQSMLVIADKHSSKWRYDFNPTKSQVIVFGDDSSPDRQLYLGDDALDVILAEKHLGVPLYTLVASGESPLDIINANISLINTNLSHH